MLYQVGLILILVVIAIIFSKKLSSSSTHETYVFEDEMDSEELKDLDDDIN